MTSYKTYYMNQFHFHYIITYVHTPSNSCNTDTSALPDMYAQARGRAVPEGKCGYIRQCMSSCVETNNYVTLPAL